MNLYTMYFLSTLFPGLPTMTALAMTIDDNIVHWIVGGIGASIPVIGLFFRVCWVQGKAFFAPMIQSAFDAHSAAVKAGADLAKEMKTQVPKVAESLDKLCETQGQQCESLKVLHEASGRHQQLHEETGKKLDKVLSHLSGGMKIVE